MAASVVSFWMEDGDPSSRTDGVEAVDVAESKEPIFRSVMAGVRGLSTSIVAGLNPKSFSPLRLAGGVFS